LTPVAEQEPMPQHLPPIATPERTAVLLGSSAFSVSILEALLTGPVRVQAVVTRPDRPAGRGRRRHSTPVKEVALKHGLTVLEPERVNAPESVRELRELAPDLLVLAAYGQILSPEVLAVPRRAPLNVHPSLLPRYRGAAPVAWALLRGERETGVTIIRMSEEVDGGYILAQAATPIGQEETAGDLETRLAQLGARLLLETIGRLDEALAQSRPQGPAPEDGSAFAPRLTKAEGLVDWSRPVENIRNQVRGLNPWPGAYGLLRHDGDTLRVKLLRVKARSEPSNGAPGTVMRVTKDHLLVQAGGGVIDIRELQAAGGRRMDVSAFLRGHPVKEGDRFVGGQ